MRYLHLVELQGYNEINVRKLPSQRAGYAMSVDVNAVQEAREPVTETIIGAISVQLIAAPE